MKDIETKPIGNTYFDDPDEYADIEAEMDAGDTCPQIIFTVPLRILDNIVRHQICVYVDEDGIKHLEDCIKECKRRLREENKTANLQGGD